MANHVRIDQFDHRAWLERMRKKHLTSLGDPSPDKAEKFIALAREAGLGYTTIGRWVGLGEAQVRSRLANRGEVPEDLMALLSIVAEQVTLMRQSRENLKPFDASAMARQMIERDKTFYGEQGLKVQATPLWFWQLAYGDVEGVAEAMHHADDETLREIKRMQSPSLSADPTGSPQSVVGLPGMSELPDLDVMLAQFNMEDL